ncbi:MAG: PilX N-terminal domain-containing pilus assembly protein [Carnobacterium sp.]|uniref:PilX N-terminal domain-containing pilus assembly protein n=1 Tax=Carnobacterium sp. TaxID=48221 RepID=UPI003C71D856
MGIKQLRKEEKGSGLVLTLMVLLVLSVLGIAIGTLTIGSYRLSDATRDDTSAYYVAEAGAVAAYDQIQREVLDAYNKNATESAFYNEVSTLLTKKNGQSNVDFDQQLGNKPSATIRTKKVDAQNYTIYSTGEIAGKERTVTKPLTVKWVGKNTGGGLPKLPDGSPALLTQGEINITGGTLDGNIHTNSKGVGSIKIPGGDKLKDSTLYYPSGVDGENLIKRAWAGNGLQKQVARGKDIDFGMYQELLNQMRAIKYNPNDFKKLPDKTIEKNQNEKYNVQDNGNLFLNNYLLDTYKLEVQDNISFDKMEVGQDKTLNIDPMGGNRTILINHLLIMGGTLNIVGEGTITLVVNDKVSFNNPAKINMSGTTNRLTLIYTGSLRYFNDINKMNGNVITIGNNNPITIKNSTINGLFLTDSKEVSLVGNNKDRPSNMMLIAPSKDAVVSMQGSSSINGTVIANTYNLSGGANLTYAPVDTTGFPFGSSGTVTDPKPEDIINSGTIVED